MQQAEFKRQELEPRRLDAKLIRERPDQEGSLVSSIGKGKSFKMKNFMQPFKIGEDIGLFLVNFECTCKKVGFTRQTWPQHLQMLLPSTAAEAVAMLTKEEAEEYDRVKSSLIRKYSSFSIDLSTMLPRRRKKAK